VLLHLFLNQSITVSASAASPKWSSPARSPLNWRARAAIIQWLLNDCPGGLLKASRGIISAGDSTIFAPALGLATVQECLFGEHGSLALRSDGASLAHFLASRVGIASLTRPGHIGATRSLDAEEELRRSEDTAQPGALEGTHDADEPHSVGALDDALLNDEFAEVGPCLLDSALKILASAASYNVTTSNGGVESASASIAERGNAHAGELLNRCCSVIGTLARRSPTLVCVAKPLDFIRLLGWNQQLSSPPLAADMSGAVRVAATLFALLASKSTASHLRASAAGALSAVAHAVKRFRASLAMAAAVHPTRTAPPNGLTSLRRLLWALSKSSDHHARLATAEWAECAFGRIDTGAIDANRKSIEKAEKLVDEEIGGARDDEEEECDLGAMYLCCCLSSDPHTDVRDAASAILARATATATATTRRAHLPPFALFVRLVHEGKGGGSTVETSSSCPRLTTLSPHSRASVLAFSSACLRESCDRLLKRKFAQAVGGEMVTRSVVSADPVPCKVAPVSGLAPEVRCAFSRDDFENGDTERVVGQGLAVAAAAAAAAAKIPERTDESDNDVALGTNPDVELWREFEVFVGLVEDLFVDTASVSLLTNNNATGGGDRGSAQSSSRNIEDPHIDPAVQASACLLFAIRCAARCHFEFRANLWRDGGSSAAMLLIEPVASRCFKLAASLLQGIDLPADLKPTAVEKVRLSIPALSRSASELIGALAPFMHSSPLLVGLPPALLRHLTSVLLESAASMGGGGGGGKSLGRADQQRVRLSSVSALRTIGSLAASVVHATLSAVGSSAPAAMDVGDALAAASLWIGNNETEVHLNACFALSRAASYAAPLPRASDTVMAAITAEMESAVPQEQNSGNLSAPLLNPQALLLPLDAPLPFGGDVRAAMAAGDRNAIRHILQRREIARLPSSSPISDQSTMSDDPVDEGGSGGVGEASSGLRGGKLWVAASGGRGDWSGAALGRCAAMVAAHSEVSERSSGAAACIGALSCCPVANCDAEEGGGTGAAVVALMASKTRNDLELHFTVGFALAAIALRSDSSGAEVVEVGGVARLDLKRWGEVADLVLQEALLDHSPVVRRNGGAWLLCLLVATAPYLRAATGGLEDGAPPPAAKDPRRPSCAVALRLPVLQRAFLGLLLERQSDVAKEIAALGLASVARAAALLTAPPVSTDSEQVSCEAAKGTLKEELLADLIQAFQRSKTTSRTAALHSERADNSDDASAATAAEVGEDEAAAQLNAALPALLEAAREAQTQHHTSASALAAAAAASANGATGRARTEEGEAGSPLDALFASLAPHRASPSGEGSAALSSHGGVYAELVDMAMAMGRPQLLYSFLSVANAHPIWSSYPPAIRCAVAARTTTGGGGDQKLSAGTDSVSIESWESTLLPRLFRLRFDPNPHTAGVMQRLWSEFFFDRAATAAAVSCHLGPLLAASIDAATKSNKWRDREAAVLAIANIVGSGGGGGGGERDSGGDGGGAWTAGNLSAATTTTSSTSTSVWRRLSPWVESLWQCALAALDDVKDSVKVAALSLAKQLLSVTRRFVDLNTARSALEVKEAVGRLLPLLLRASTSTTSTVESDDDLMDDFEEAEPDQERVELVQHPPRSHQGRDRSVVVMSPEGRAVATAALVSVVDAAGVALRPFAARVVITVCTAVSELEPALLSYLQFHSDGLVPSSNGPTASGAAAQSSSFAGLEELRLSLAKQGPLAAALRSALALASNRRVARSLLPPLFGLLRRGVGLATRATCAQVVDELCERCPEELRRPLKQAGGCSAGGGGGGGGEVPARKLLFLLCELSLSERSPSVRRAFTNSLANVAKIAPPLAVRTLLHRQLVSKRYRAAAPGDHAEKLRVVSAIAQICRRCGSTLDASVWPQLLSLAFVCRHEPKDPTASLEATAAADSVAASWELVWTHGLSACQVDGAADTLHESSAAEGGTASSTALVSAAPVAALRSLLPFLVAEICGRALADKSWLTRRAGAAAAASLASSLGPELNTREVGEPSAVTAELVASVARTRGSDNRHGETGEGLQGSSESERDEAEEQFGGQVKGRERAEPSSRLQPAQQLLMVPAGLVLLRSLALAVTGTHGRRVWDGKHELFSALVTTAVACAFGKRKPAGSGETGSCCVLDATAPHTAWLLCPGDSLLAEACAPPSTSSPVPLPGEGCAEGTRVSCADGQTTVVDLEAFPEAEDAGESRRSKMARCAGGAEDFSAIVPASSTVRGVCVAGLVTLLVHQCRPLLPKEHRRACCTALAALLSAVQSSSGSGDPRVCYHSDPSAAAFGDLVSLVAPPLALYTNLQLFEPQENTPGMLERNDSRQPGTVVTDIVMQCRAIVSIAESWPLVHDLPSTEELALHNVAVQRHWTPAFVRTCVSLLPLSTSVWTVRCAALDALTIILTRVWIGGTIEKNENTGVDTALASPITTATGEATPIATTDRKRAAEVKAVLTTSMLDSILTGVKMNLGDGRYSQVRLSAAKTIAALARRRPCSSEHMFLVPHRDSCELMLRTSCLTPTATAISQATTDVASTAMRAFATWGS